MKSWVPISLMRQGVSVLCIVLILFVLIEPAISSGATTASSQFTISQTVNSELSFSTPATSVTMSPSLGGITGGTANGGTQFVITSGSSAGYTVTLTASSSIGMIGNASSSNSIPAYIPSTINVPDFAFAVPANKAYFGYSVEASTTSDVAQIFKDNGSICNTGAGETVNACWLNASSSAVMILNRSTQTPSSGATTTLKFRVIINSNPSPVIPDDTYVATTTLTATTN